MQWETDKGGVRRRNRVEVALHFVWTTFERRPMVTPDVERSVYRSIQREAQRLGAEVLALNGMPDHVHLAVLMPTTISIAKFMQQVKGVSSSIARDQLGEDHFFRWEEGYGAFAFSRSHRDRIVTYIQNQKRHHEANKLWPEWEEPNIYEPNPSPQSSPRPVGRSAEGLLDRHVHVPGNE